MLVLFPAAMLFAIFYATLALPFFGQAKAFYALSTTPVLALCFARGYHGVDTFLAARTGWPGQLALFATTATCLAAMYLSFAG